MSRMRFGLYQGQPVSNLPHDYLLRIIRTGLRVCAKASHPDRGGTHLNMVELNRANEWLEALP